MASKCPECNQPYDFDEYKRTGKCSECGKVINNPQKYGTTRYERATQKSVNKKKTEKVEQEIIDTSQINREVKKKAVEKAKEETEKSDVPKFTPENNSKIIIDEKDDTDVGNGNDSSFLSEEDDEIAELRRKLEEQKRINEQLKQQERERIEQEKNIEEQRRKQANELEKQRLLKMLEEEQKKNKEMSQKLQGEVPEDNSSEPVVQKSPTKKELLQQMENKKIQESKERLFNKNKVPDDTTIMDVTSDYTEETDNLELSSPTSTDENEDNVSGETHKNAADWLKKKIEASNKKLNGDEMEMEGIEYASNIDGYYDDIPSRTPIKPDTIPKIFFLKIAGVIIGTFAFIAFLIYYA